LENVTLNDKQQENGRGGVLLFAMTGLQIACLDDTARCQTLVQLLPKPRAIEIDRVSFRAPLAQFSNFETDRFKQEQLQNSGSSTSITAQTNIDGWSQPIIYVFSIVFVLLGLLTAWSKYNRKR
jgi:hypothetical protein